MLIGVVGKANTGKSTFFKAATLMDVLIGIIVPMLFLSSIRFLPVIIGSLKVISITLFGEIFSVLFPL